MLSCEQIPCLLQEHLRCSCDSILCDASQSELLDHISSQFSVPFISLEQLTPSAEGVPALWILAKWICLLLGVTQCFGDYRRVFCYFLDSPQACSAQCFQVCNPFFCGRNTQMDASRQTSPCGQSPFRRSMVAGCLVLKDFFLSVSLFPRNSVVESWTVANPFFFPLGFRLFSGSCFTPHLFPREHWPIVVHCTQSPLFLCPLPLDMSLAAAAPAADFSSCLSREENGFSRTISDHHLLVLIWLLQNLLVGFLLHRD